MNSHDEGSTRIFELIMIGSAAKRLSSAGLNGWSICKVYVEKTPYIVRRKIRQRAANSRVNFEAALPLECSETVPPVCTILFIAMNPVAYNFLLQSVSLQGPGTRMTLLELLANG